jgi:NitT/TauT family transport system ATP-binding protein
LSTNAFPIAAANVGQLTVTNVGKAFGVKATEDAEFAVRHVDLTVEQGEFLILLGPSGCGKTTLLRMMAGITNLSEGQITTADGLQVSRPDRRRGMVFQSSEAALFDWLSARANVEFGLRLMGIPKEQRQAEASMYLSLVGLSGHEHKFPGTLSGGMRQRLQIARALAPNPDILLMDEPFASVDAQTRRILQGEVQRLWLETKKTIVYVTHDIREALLLGDRIAIMTTGPASKIDRIYRQDLPRPRDEAEPAFVERYREIESRIAAEVTKGWSVGRA